MQGRIDFLMKTPLFVFVLSALAISALTGCGSQGTTLSGAEAEAVLAFSEARTDNLLAGMNSGDYAAFSQDFDAEMLSAMTEAEFNNLKADRDEKLGLYVSRQVVSVVQIDDFYAVNYTAVFEKEAAVGMRVVFRMEEPHEVSGLWFDK